MTKTMKEVADNFCGPETDVEFWQEEYRKAHALSLEFAIQAERAEAVIREAYEATYSKPTCSRDFVVREILEKAIGEWDEG